MKKRCAALCMLLAAALVFAGCKETTPPETPPGGNEPGTETPVTPPTGGGEQPAEKKKLNFSATVQDCFGTALEGVALSLNGKSAGESAANGAFTLQDVEEAESNVLILTLEGYVSESVPLGEYYAKAETEVDLGTVRMVKNAAVVSSLEARGWTDFEAFTLDVTRSESALLLTAGSPNKAFTKAGRKSTLEFYVSVGEVAATRDKNVTKVAVKSDGTTEKVNYGGKDLSSYTVTAEMTEQGEGLSVTVALPFDMIGCANDDILGLAMGLYSDTDGGRAEMLALDGKSTVDFFTPATYLRTDKNNAVFACAENCRPEDATPPVDKAALTAGYPMQFSVPGLCKSADGDDFYLKAEKESDGFLVSMVGFGSFSEKEYVKLIFHASRTHASGWNVQASDLNVLVNRTKANYRTNITKFWNADGGYTVFGNDAPLTNAPVYTDRGGYFTLTLKVLFHEIPAYDENGTVSLFAMEFADNGTANGLIYDATDYRNGMLIDGVSHGDPAAQSSYFVIQGGEEDAVDPALIAGFDMQFAMAADDIYAKVERGATSLTLTLRSFHTFDPTDFVRFVVHTGAPIGANNWALDKDDVSFTIYKDSAYFQTGKISFFEGAANAFHGNEQTLHAPVYTQSEGYWTLTLEIEYIELGMDVDASTRLSAFLGEYVSNELASGAKQNGVSLGDMAYQSNWFILTGGDRA